MNATHANPRRSTSQRRRKTNRSVQNILLELTYLLHANRVVRREPGSRGK